MLMIPVGLRSEKGCVVVAQQKLKTTDPTSRQRGRPTQQIRNCLKIIKERRKKIVPGPRWVPDTKIDWPADRRS
jgi:hypothetical protein